MKKLFSVLLVITLCFFGVTQAKDAGYITVQQSDFVEIEPNVAQMDISIETMDVDINKATTDNKNNAQKVYKALSAIMDDGDYLKTNNYTITPRYTTVDKKRVFDTYIVTNTISLKTHNLLIIPKILDTAVTEGANRINNLQLFASNYDEAGNELLAKLTNKAYIRASVIASSINSTVTGIKNINANFSTEDRPRYYSMSLTKDSATNSSATPFEKGKIKIYGNVNADFYVK